MRFDFVIVGAGSAGCVLTDRLTRSGRLRVLLLEAGGTDRRLYVQMPLGFGKTFFDDRVNWNYLAEPDPGLSGRRDHWPRGKLLGGSSSINSMVWIRGHRADFDEWRDAGNPGWGYDDLLPAFKATETSTIGDPRWRGRDGPSHLTDQTSLVHPLTHRFLEACAEAGLPKIADLNGPEPEGAAICEITTRNGIRMSAARAFLRPAAWKAADLILEDHRQEQ